MRGILSGAGVVGLADAGGLGNPGTLGALGMRKSVLAAWWVRVAEVAVYVGRRL